MGAVGGVRTASVGRVDTAKNALVKRSDGVRAFAKRQGAIVTGKVATVKSIAAARAQAVSANERTVRESLMASGAEFSDKVGAKIAASKSRAAVFLHPAAAPCGRGRGSRLRVAAKIKTHVNLI